MFRQRWGLNPIGSPSRALYGGNIVARVDFFRYDFNFAGFQAGDVEVIRFGPYDFGNKALAWTAHPFNLSTQTRNLEITSVVARTTPASPSGQQWVIVAVRNNGPDPVGIWQLFLGMISP